MKPVIPLVAQDPEVKLVENIATVDTSTRKVGVLWSGGFDSTSLILKYLDEGCIVYAYSARLDNNKMQSLAEQTARENLYELISREKNTHKLRRYDIGSIRVDNNNTNGISQPQLWLLLASFGIHSDLDELAIGWVRGDDVWHYRTEVMTLWDHLSKLRHMKVPLVFPFEWETKEEILRVWKNRKSLFKYLSSSETGNVLWDVIDHKYDEKNTELRNLYSKLKKMTRCIPTLRK